MKKENRFGRIVITREGVGKFINFNAANLAAHTFGWSASDKGYLTSTTVCKENRRAEVCIYLDSKQQPKFPASFKFSRKEITSYQHYSEITKTWSFLRCVTYYFLA